MSYFDVRAAIIGGDGRARPFLTLDIIRDQIPAHAGLQDPIDHVWLGLVKVDERSVENLQHWSHLASPLYGRLKAL